MVAILPQMEAHMENKMGDTRGLYYFQHGYSFFQNSPSISSDLEGKERSSKLFHFVTEDEPSKNKKRFEMDGVSFNELECKVPKEDEAIHIIRDWKQKKRLETLTCFYFPEWVETYLKILLSRNFPVEWRQQSSGAVRCAQTEETGLSFKKKSRENNGALSFPSSTSLAPIV